MKKKTKTKNKQLTCQDIIIAMSSGDAEVLKNIKLSKPYRIEKTEGIPESKGVEHTTHRN